ncbi:MAG TPA: hypothetical protein VJT08_06145 [Terriglobales bacterium]|nr:hypothetical protein [Terriglobales bacterium]
MQTFKNIILLERQAGKVEESPKKTSGDDAEDVSPVEVSKKEN